MALAVALFAAGVVLGLALGVIIGSVWPWLRRRKVPGGAPDAPDAQPDLEMGEAPPLQQAVPAPKTKKKRRKPLTESQMLANVSTTERRKCKSNVAEVAQRTVEDATSRSTKRARPEQGAYSELAAPRLGSRGKNHYQWKDVWEDLSLAASRA